MLSCRSRRGKETTFLLSYVFTSCVAFKFGDSYAMIFSYLKFLEIWKCAAIAESVQKHTVLEAWKSEIFVIYRGWPRIYCRILCRHPINAIFIKVYSVYYTQDNMYSKSRFKVFPNVFLNPIWSRLSINQLENIKCQFMEMSHCIGLESHRTFFLTQYFNWESV